jgi:alkanesulfonate monooxygenase SsuD/methylene tetrahydromethanopterin reductase-like flavin-dependent oxidoreductase (luciferase family)
MISEKLELNLMIEGQEDLTWERWERLARAAEDGGFGGLYRSDHLTGLFGHPTRSSLETWASLAWLATATRRIRFGPVVCPMTFYQPALLAKTAAAIDQRAGGRLDLGIGAGWNEMEHRMFGIPFPPLRERMDRLECGARVIRALWRGVPVTLDQPYYPLVEAQSFPLPAGGGLIVGGRGERRTMRVAAELADEWNVTSVTFDEYPRKLEVLAGHCRAIGRDMGAIRRSLMAPIVIGRTRAEVAARLARGREWFPRVPGSEAEWRAQSFLFGSVDEVVRDLRRWQALGIQRVMLQCLDADDLAAIELVAREVIPALA